METKTDKDNKGVTKFIANLRGCLNPYNLIKALQIARVALKPNDPFFVNSHGTLVKFIQVSMK